MSIAYWIVLLVAVMPLVWVGYAKTGAKGYDNSRPREFLAGLHGPYQRANWAQQNALEAFPPFAAAVIIAQTSGATQLWVDVLACVFLAARVAHGIAYITDRAMLRSLVWLVGFLCVVFLFVIAA